MISSINNASSAYTPMNFKSRVLLTPTLENTIENLKKNPLGENNNAQDSILFINSINALLKDKRSDTISFQNKVNLETWQQEDNCVITINKKNIEPYSGKRTCIESVIDVGHGRGNNIYDLRNFPEFEKYSEDESEANLEKLKKSLVKNLDNLLNRLKNQK